MSAFSFNSWSLVASFDSKICTSRSSSIMRSASRLSSPVSSDNQQVEREPKQIAKKSKVFKKNWTYPSLAWLSFEVQHSSFAKLRFPLRMPVLLLVGQNLRYGAFPGPQITLGATCHLGETATPFPKPSSQSEGGNINRSKCQFWAILSAPEFFSFHFFFTFQSFNQRRGPPLDLDVQSRQWTWTGGSWR